MRLMVVYCFQYKTSFGNSASILGQRPSHSTTIYSVVVKSETIFCAKFSDIFTVFQTSFYAAHAHAPART